MRFGFMNRPENNKDGAIASLDVLREINEQAKVSFRAPAWLTGIAALSFGVATFSYCAMRHENMWAMGLIVSGVIFLLTGVFFAYISKLSGIKHRIIPVTSRGRKLFLFQALVYGAAFVVGRQLSEEGFVWAPYAAGFLNMALLATLAHKFPALDNTGVEG
jgi:hypothetical protein